MADEKVDLMWVEAPTIVDGAVGYAYSNIGTATATFVSEMINVMPADGSPNQVQSYQLDHLEVGAEQRTHAPVSSDLADGAVQVLVSIQATSDQKDWDATLEAQAAGVVSGGVLYASEAAPATGGGGSITIEIHSFELEGSDAVVHYRVTGDATVQMMTASVSLSRSSGAQAWMTAPHMDNDREDIVRIALPSDIVDEEDGWELRIAIAATGGQNGPEGFVGATLPVRKVDSLIVADGNFTIS
jgi:hypothetical protein